MVTPAYEELESKLFQALKVPGFDIVNDTRRHVQACEEQKPKPGTYEYARYISTLLHPLVKQFRTGPSRGLLIDGPVATAMAQEGWIPLAYMAGLSGALADPSHVMVGAAGLLRALCTQLLYELRETLRLDLLINDSYLEEIETGNIHSLCRLFYKLLENTVVACGNKCMIVCLIDGAHFLERAEIELQWSWVIMWLRYILAQAIHGTLSGGLLFKYLIIHGNTSSVDDRPVYSYEDKLAVCGTAEAYRKAEIVKDVTHERVGKETGFNLREAQKHEFATTHIFGEPILNLFGPSPEEAFPHAGMITQDYQNQRFWTFAEFIDHLPGPLYPGSPPQVAAISPFMLSEPSPADCEDSIPKDSGWPPAGPSIRPASV